MDRAAFDKVLDDEVIVHNGKAYAWTIPISFPVDRSLAGSLKIGGIRGPGQCLQRTGRLPAGDDIFPFDKARYFKSVYGTERTDHPGGRMVLSDPRDMLLGGEVRVLPQPKTSASMASYVLPPRETRALFRKRGWKRVVAFQTRNPLHRAHEYALVAGMETLDARRATMPGPCSIRSSAKPRATTSTPRTPHAHLSRPDRQQGPRRRRQGRGTSGRRSAATSPTSHPAVGLDIKMFYGGPKEAIMHGIYRQNFGFTDIIIGRKHADAPYDDGKDIWDGLAAQRKFDELKGELLIKPVKVGFAAFYEELGRVGLVDECTRQGLQASLDQRPGAAREASGRRITRLRASCGRRRHIF